MPLKPGDQLTLSIGPTIKLGDSYQFLKPHASISRKLTDPSVDVPDMRATLRRALFVALKTEVEVLNDTYQCGADTDDLDTLVQFCVKEIKDGEVETSVTEGEAEEGAAVEIDGKGDVVPVKPKGKPKLKLKVKPKGAKLKVKPKGKGGKAKIHG